MVIMKTCKVEDCSEPHRAKGFCHRHFAQWSRTGAIIPKSRNDKNDFIIDGEITRIVLCNKSREKVAEAIIDTCDLEKCKKLKWWLNPDGYVRGSTKGIGYIKFKTYEKEN
jgi:hypothetical protein